MVFLASFLIKNKNTCFVCLSPSSVDPVWMPRRVTWSWTVGNKISLPPSSASPRRLPTRLTRASPHRLHPSPAFCATPGPPPTPRTPSKSPPYNVRQCPQLPPPHRRPTSQPMNSELPLNLWSWTQGTASWDFGDKDYTDGYFEYRWLLSLPLPILWITWDELKWRQNGLPHQRQSIGTGKSSKNQRQGIWKGTITSRRLSCVLRITPSCILDPNTLLPPCTVLTFWVSLHKPREGSCWTDNGKEAKTPKEWHAAHCRLVSLGPFCISTKHNDFEEGYKMAAENNGLIFSLTLVWMDWLVLFWRRRWCLGLGNESEGLPTVGGSFILSWYSIKLICDWKIHVTEKICWQPNNPQWLQKPWPQFFDYFGCWLLWETGQ